MPIVFILLGEINIMDNNLAQKAISAAVKGKWEEAQKLNKEILRKNPRDTDALNRLARSYAELGDIKNARITANKTLKIDPHNNIAQKCLSRWKELKKEETIRSTQTSADSFIEEPGKTKILTLLHTGPEKILAKSDAGDEVKINPHGHRISVANLEGNYLGRLPDDISARLKKLIKMGNEYQILIKSIEKKCVRVFIRETKTSPKAVNIPSFSSERIDYISFTPPELVHKKDQITPEGGIEE
jgi:tetratricopeptide (TPR) repeat protein